MAPTIQGGEPMLDKWLVIVGDTETGKWSIIADTPDEKTARGVDHELRMGADPSPTIVIFTGDFIQV